MVEERFSHNSEILTKTSSGEIWVNFGAPALQGEMLCYILHSIVKMCFKATWEFIEMSCWSGRHLLALVRGGLYCLCCWLVERNVLPCGVGVFLPWEDLIFFNVRQIGYDLRLNFVCSMNLW